MLDELDKVVDESQITRRKVIGRSLIGALGALVPADDRRPGRPRPVADQEDARRDHRDDDLGRGHPAGPRRHLRARSRPRDIEIGQLVNAEPENLQGPRTAPSSSRQKAKAAIIIVRMDPNTIKIPDSRKDWQVGGILCYSKICTHVGCPISLWEQQTHHLLCPCHQSTFDLGDSGRGGLRPGRARAAAAADHHRRRGLPRRPAWFQRPDRPELLRAGLAQRLQRGR